MVVELFLVSFNSVNVFFNNGLYMFVLLNGI